MYLLMVLLMMFTPQTHLNDCGVASMLMVAEYYDIDTQDITSADLHYQITDGKDRALHITEVVLQLREWGIQTEYTYSHVDISRALVDGDYPMIYLLEDRAHFIVLYNGYMLDPREGITRLTMREFINEYNTGVGLLIEEVYK